MGFVLFCLCFFSLTLELFSQVVVDIPTIFFLILLPTLREIQAPLTPSIPHFHAAPSEFTALEHRNFGAISCSLNFGADVK